MLKLVFIVISISLFMLICIGKLFVFNKLRPNVVGGYAAFIAAFIMLYSLFALGLMTQGSIFDKFIMLIFALSPYMIGQITSYKNVGFFTGVQLFSIILSIFYVVYCV